MGDKDTYSLIDKEKNEMQKKRKVIETFKNILKILFLKTDS